MSFLVDLLEELDNYNPYFYDFGGGLHPNHIHRHNTRHHRHEPLTQNSVGYVVPLSTLLGRVGDRQMCQRNKKECENKVVTIGKGGFQVCMDVQQFKPSELNVKVVENHIVVEGKHEEREDDHGYISRHFVRRYALPKGYDADKVVSTLSSDGVLTVSVPKPAIEDKSNERVVQIQQTGPAHLNVKDNAQEKVGDSCDAANGGDEAQK